MPSRPRIRWILALTALFAFRLLYGLSSEFFSQDETQIFLLGLRYHATGAWPYFGPDVVWTASEIPGALQALLVGWPLNVAPIPEAPFVLLNLLSTGALGWYAWYIAARLPSVPRWLIAGWLMTIPWTLAFSTHINNPSYILPAALAFFIGFFEALPTFTLGRIPLVVAFAVMGAATTWTMQIHLSWPLLVPYAAVAWLTHRRDGLARLALYAGAFVAGAAVPGLALLPTLLTYGMSSGGGGVLRNLEWHVVSPVAAVVVLARFFSFASLEVVRFLELTTARRLALLESHLWLVPFALAAWLAGLLQPIWMLREWFRGVSPYREWPALKTLVAATVLMVYASYWLVIERATEAHAFYVLAPVAFMFAAYCWTFIDSPAWRKRAAVLLAINIAYEAGLAWAHAPTRSLYKDRQIVAAAIGLHHPDLLGHRRAFAKDVGTACVCLVPRDPDPRQDVTIAAPAPRRALGGVIAWTVRVDNRGRSAYRDILCRMTYQDASGQTVDTRQTTINRILQPGETWLAPINDSLQGRAFTSATVELIDAEAVPAMPRPSRTP